MKSVCIFFLLAAILCAADFHPGAEETAQLLTEIIRVNTSNPPGNEGQLAEFLAPRFRAAGFEVDIIPTPQAGKAHFIARLRGDGSKRPVLLAGHADVVGVEREKWTVDPFAGLVRDGYIYGRGAIDFKGGLAVFAQAALMLARNKVPLARDVIFLSESDEESAKYNTGWLAESHWDKIDCEFSLNEGGWIMKNPDGSVRYISISTADKTSVALVLTATGTSTHSSMPRPDNAIFTLARALAKVADYDTRPNLIPSTREFFETLAKTATPPMSDVLPRPRHILRCREDRRRGPRDQQRYAAARDHAQHHRPGAAERRLPRQRDSRFRLGDTEFPHCSGH